MTENIGDKRPINITEAVVAKGSPAKKPRVEQDTIGTNPPIKAERTASKSRTSNSKKKAWSNEVRLLLLLCDTTC